MPSAPTYCIRCDAPDGRCVHSLGEYADVRYADLTTCTPVETTAGEEIRREALRFLGDRYRALAARAGAFDFSQIEIQHMADLERTLERLQQMRPSGPLEPPNERLAYPAVV